MAEEGSGGNSSIRALAAGRASREAATMTSYPEWIYLVEVSRLKVGHASRALMLAAAVATIALAGCGSPRCSPSCPAEFICVESSQQAVCADTRTSCGGFGGLLCPEGYKSCVDDPRDSCDPGAGGADCIGLCAR